MGVVWLLHTFSAPEVSAVALQSTAAIPLTLSPFRQSLFTMPRMRNVVLGLGISLDGYIARPDGSVDFLFMPKDYSMGPFFATVDSAIMGRKTYDDALKMGGSFGGSAMTSYVMSRTVSPGEQNGAHFVNDTPVELVRKL